MERNYKTKRSERHNGGPQMGLEFKFLPQVSDNLNQSSQAAIITSPLCPVERKCSLNLVSSLWSVSSYLKMK